MKKAFFTAVLLAFTAQAMLLAQQVIDVDLYTLLSEWEDNSLRAKQQYGGKTIRTTGEIYTITSDGSILLQVNSLEHYFMSMMMMGVTDTTVWVYFNRTEVAKLANLRKEQTITVRGVYDGDRNVIRNAVIETGAQPQAQQQQPQAQPQQPARQQPAPAPQPTPAPAPVQPAATPQNSVSGNMVRINGGTFQMGSDNGDYNEKPVHTVTASSFYMGKYEVTQREWYDVMGTTVRQQRDKVNSSWPISGEGDNYPMKYVSWYEAIEYCNRRSQREGLTPAYTIGGSGNSRTATWNRNANGYRLPTEAEWEYAAKGGNGSPGNYTYSGSNNADEVAWYNNNGGSTSKVVGTKKPNGLGLYDMSGNVHEWCWDWWGNYSSSAQTDPTGASPESGRRVLRGGGSSNSAKDVRSAYRTYVPPYDGGGFGFRLARN